MEIPSATLRILMRRLFCFALVISSLFAENVGERWWKHVQFLADDKLEGRNTGSEGHRQAAAYVAAEFERLGLKAAGTQGYLQPVLFTTRQIDEANSKLEIVREGKAVAVELGKQAYFGLRTDPAPVVRASMVFVGYGLRVPEQNHDDLKGLNLKGKIAVMLAGAPKAWPGRWRRMCSRAMCGGSRCGSRGRLG
jgi:hypothetical protein